MARPKITFTKRDLRAIERLAGCGLSQQAIAHALGFSEDTLSRRKAESDDVAQAIARGRAKTEGQVGQALVRKALKGDVPAIRWFEATRFGRSEKQVVEHHDSTLEDLIRAAAADESDSETGGTSDVE